MGIILCNVAEMQSTCRKSSVINLLSTSTITNLVGRIVKVEDGARLEVMKLDNSFMSSQTHPPQEYSEII